MAKKKRTQSKSSKRKKKLFSIFIAILFGFSIIAFAISYFGGAPKAAGATNLISAAVKNGGAFQVIVYKQYLTSTTSGEKTITSVATNFIIESITYTPPSSLSGYITLYNSLPTASTDTPNATGEITYSSPYVVTSIGSTAISRTVRDPIAVITNMLVYRIYTNGLYGKAVTVYRGPSYTLELYEVDPQIPEVYSMLSSAGLLGQGLTYYFGYFVLNMVTYGIDFQARYSTSIIYEENVNAYSIISPATQT